MNAFTITTLRRYIDLPPAANHDSGSGSSGSSIVGRGNTDLPLVDEDSSGSSGSCVIA
jgi:hypothetical protein